MSNVPDAILYLSESDSLKLREYTVRLREIFDRDLDPATRSRRDLQGMEDYILRAAIEALGIDDLFYEPEGMYLSDKGINR